MNLFYIIRATIGWLLTVLGLCIMPNKYRTELVYEFYKKMQEKSEQ